LADTAERANLFPVDSGEGWLDGAQQEWAGQAHAIEHLAEYARFDRLDVDNDVGQFGHGDAQPTVRRSKCCEACKPVYLAITSKSLSLCHTGTLFSMAMA